MGGKGKKRQHGSGNKKRKDSDDEDDCIVPLPGEMRHQGHGSNTASLKKRRKSAKDRQEAKVD